MNENILKSVAFALFWVYGLLTIVSFVTSLVVPEAVANPVVMRATLRIGDNPTWFSIALNNSIIFLLYILTPFNMAVPATAFAFGCLARLHGIRGVAVLPVLARLYVEPFTFFEFGALVFAMTISFYAWKYKRKRWIWQCFNWKQLAVFFLIGIGMLIIGACLEMVAIG